MAEYELCDSFHIDHGELSGLSNQKCFVLGVEWQMFASQLENGRAFERTIHPENLMRFQRLLNSKGRIGAASWLNDDWMSIKVEEMS